MGGCSPGKRHKDTKRQPCWLSCQPLGWGPWSRRGLGQHRSLSPSGQPGLPSRLPADPMAPLCSGSWLFSVASLLLTLSPLTHSASAAPEQALSYSHSIDGETKVQRREGMCSGSHSGQMAEEAVWLINVSCCFCHGPAVCPWWLIPFVLGVKFT